MSELSAGSFTRINSSEAVPASFGSGMSFTEDTPQHVPEPTACADSRVTFGSIPGEVRTADAPKLAGHSYTDHGQKCTGIHYSVVSDRLQKKLNPLGRLAIHPCMLRLLSITGVFLSFAFSAQGHAILMSATPVIGQVVHRSDLEVSLRFNSRVDVKRSRIILVPQGGSPRALELREQSSPDSLISQIRGLKNGAYILRWQVLAVDGHISRGEVPFRVHLGAE